MEDVARFRSQLLAWYDVHRRTLPWRAAPGERSDPYRVWLSEIMLQQTTVAHATPYFLEFIRRWPSVRDLAAAADEDVMAAWAGLGYYARARNLLACARAVAKIHGGRFPDDETSLRALPGLGAYTAAAVAAIAFDRPANVVDGNVERVMSRLFAVETPLPAAKPELAALAATLVARQRPGDWAQALMDLGATICRPATPACEFCPGGDFCRAAMLGDPAGYPRRAARAARPHRHGIAYRLIHDGCFAALRRPARGLLGGTLGLPTTEWRAKPWPRAEAIAHAPAPGSWREIGAVDHVFTHFSLSLTVYEARAAKRDAPFLWIPLARASDMPTVFRKAVGAA